ncbi:MAG: type II toxin-antitoxin system HicB family antitoxin [Planctomycetes bacterium]|nr:type II toxin-antitoxin system HicB family antitoxin [Planctomycetota bacterium]
MRYAVVIEKGPTSYGAYVPDLPGCVVGGDSVEEVKQLIAESIDLHLDGLRQSGASIPTPTSICVYVDASFTVGKPGCDGSQR